MSSSNFILKVTMFSVTLHCCYCVGDFSPCFVLLMFVFSMALFVFIFLVDALSWWCWCGVDGWCFLSIIYLW